MSRTEVVAPGATPAQFSQLTTGRRCRVKKPREQGTDVPARRGPGRPAGEVPAKSNAQRQEALRLRLKAEGRKVLHLNLLPETIERFDALRDAGTTREEAFERLVDAASRRKR
jgi:hypothetical protein